MIYDELERQYNQYVKECEKKLQDGFIILSDEEVEVEKDERLRNRGFIYDVLQLRILTEMAELDPDKYDFELDFEFKEVKTEVAFKYIGNTSKEKYDRLLAFRILLGDRYEYWRNILEKENKTLFKRPVDIKHILYVVLDWVRAALDIGHIELAQELLDNAKPVLEKHKGMTSLFMHVYDQMHKKNGL